MTPPTDRSVAGLIGDRYEIEGLIASGGMGSVYRARDTVLDRIVALKVLHETGDGSFVERFRTEATNAARLSHPNIVAVYDFGSADGRPYMAMEFVDGQTLRDILTAKRVVRPEIAASIAASVASALEHARRAGIVHRDVKPENILISTDGRVKVADFGLSRALASATVTQAGEVFGTAHYLAPEQVRGGTADARADVYALGIVLYEMLTGRTPFTGDTPAAVAYARLTEPVPSPSARNPSVPDALDDVVARATARDADDRFPTPGEMAQALRTSVPSSGSGDIGVLVHHTEAIPLHTTPTVRIERGERTKRARRRRVGWIAAATALAMLATLLLFVVGPLRTAEVPSVVTRTQEEAQRILRARGFDTEVVLRQHEDVAVGLVIVQDPPGGARTRVGRAVRIAVSLGPQLIAVPDVTDMEYVDAEAELRTRGFVNIVREDVFSAEPRLQVVAQDPESGMLVSKQTEITVRVSKGIEQVRVPDVRGDPEAGAVADLEQLGLKAAIERSESTTVPEGRVVSQNPPAGKTVDKGSTVTLEISKGPPQVTVPSLSCMTRKQAQDALANAGLKASFSGSGKRVVDQSPAPGAKAPKGSAVTVYMGFGSFC